MSNTDSDPKGWRIAAMVVLLAAGLTAGAYAIHRADFCDPNHPLCNREKPKAEHADASHAGDSHAPAAAGASHDASHDSHDATKADTAKHDTTHAAPGKGRSGGH